jgi:hypothetical protein
MDEEILYRVCPHRNVPAAFQRFLGPDSGGIERFFPQVHGLRLDDTVWEVRMKGRRIFEAMRDESQHVALIVSDVSILARALFIVASAAAASWAKDGCRSLQGLLIALLIRARSAAALPL